MGKKMAYQANRDGVAERCPDPAVQQRIAVDLALMDHDARLLRDRVLAIIKTAKPHDANTLDLCARSRASARSCVGGSSMRGRRSSVAHGDRI